MFHTGANHLTIVIIINMRDITSFRMTFPVLQTTHNNLSVAAAATQ